mmetsp:Transcript_7197/g.28313  ORF Transcript_7197/g.28313 Transcript_7197/m.28313 type:complete len:203 (-) Transcript_7197:1293-1901(-)
MSGCLSHVQATLRSVVLVLTFAVDARRRGSGRGDRGGWRGERAVSGRPVIDRLLVVLHVFLRPVSVPPLELLGREAILAGQAATLAARLSHDRLPREPPIGGGSPADGLRGGVSRRRLRLSPGRTRGAEEELHETALGPPERQADLPHPQRPARVALTLPGLHLPHVRRFAAQTAHVDRVRRLADASRLAQRRPVHDPDPQR